MPMFLPKENSKKEGIINKPETTLLLKDSYFLLDNQYLIGLS